MMKTNQIIHGDCLDILPSIESDSIDCIVTSPPYWGLRDYQVEGQIGQEPLLNEYITKMLLVTAECKRILKPTGTMFWVHGNSYGGVASQPYGNRKGVYAEMLPHGLRRPKYIEKCLTMQNFRLAIRMIDDQGWILRNTIIWHKKNSMPSSVKDRLTNTYEPVFFFSKNKKYYFDLDAIRVPQKDASKKKIVTAQKQIGSKSIKNKEMHIFNRTYRSTKDICEKRDPQKGKNPGDVVALSTQPFPEAHFAVFSEKLIEPFIKAACPQNGIVLDPFMGVGTTAVVAKRLSRNYLGIELNPEYIKIATKRISKIPTNLDNWNNVRKE